MAEKVLKDCKLLVGGYDISGNTNSMTVTISADVLDRTGFGSSFRKRKSGLKSFEVAGSGFWDASADPANKVGGFDERLFNDIGGTTQTLTIAEGSSGSKAILGYGVGANYAPSGSIGELMGFDFAAQGSRDPVFGRLARASTMKGTSGDGIAVKVGTATTSTRKLYAALHVIKGTTKSGHTVDVQIVNADTSAMSSPTTVGGFTQLKTTDHHVRLMWATTKASTENGWYQVIWKASTAAAKVRAYVSIGKQKG